MNLINSLKTIPYEEIYLIPINYFLINLMFLKLI